jgi:hypothetical protein
MLKRLIPFLPFLLPFIAFGIYVLVARWRDAQGKPSWEEAPWAWLAIVGLAFVIVTLVGLALIGDGNIAGTYIPDRFEDGRIVPGEIR